MVAQERIKTWANNNSPKEPLDLSGLNLTIDDFDFFVSFFLSNPELISELSLLNLSENNLTDIPKEIISRCFANIKVLLLNNNKLTCLPDELRYCTSISGIYLDGNLISEIPAPLFALGNLKNIGLNNNKINHIGGKFCGPIRNIFVIDNPIKTICPNFYQNNLELHTDAFGTLWFENGVIKEFDEVNFVIYEVSIEELNERLK